ncbi:hypothetical protein C8R47DRAFT_1067728 [Mycena vitilis]|nr:hypothetical protein C8R47DRAFT_1067728 [Mycena vitilis]
MLTVVAIVPVSPWNFLAIALVLARVKSTKVVARALINLVGIDKQNIPRIISIAMTKALNFESFNLARGTTATKNAQFQASPLVILLNCSQTKMSISAHTHASGAPIMKYSTALGCSGVLTSGKLGIGELLRVRRKEALYPRRGPGRFGVKKRKSPPGANKYIDAMEQPVFAPTWT